MTAAPPSWPPSATPRRWRRSPPSAPSSPASAAAAAPPSPPGAAPEDGGLRVDGAVLSPDGRDSTRASVRGPLEAAERLGADLAERVKAAGGRAILSACAA